MLPLSSSNTCPTQGEDRCVRPCSCPRCSPSRWPEALRFAENPHESSPAKAPRVIERLRSRGDMVDKSYRGNDRGARAPQDAGSQVAKQAQQGKQVIDKTSSRINCSEGGAPYCRLRAAPPRLTARMASRRRRARSPRRALLAGVPRQDPRQGSDECSTRPVKIRACRAVR